MTITPTSVFSHPEQFEHPAYSFALDDKIFKDWLDSDTIVNFVGDNSPVNTFMSDLEDITHEEDIESNYSSMPRNLRRVLTPPLEYKESSSKRRSIPFEPSMSACLGMSSYSKSGSENLRHPMNRARQSVSSIASCSTVYTKSAPVPVKSILTRRDSGISLATTTKTSRRKKRLPPSVKFVEPPMVHHHSQLPSISSALHSSPISPGQRKIGPSRWFAWWWKSTPSTPPRPIISGPYSLGRTASLVDVHASRSRLTKCRRLKRFWIHVTGAAR